MTSVDVGLVPVVPTVRTYALHLELVRRMHRWATRYRDVFDVRRFGPTCMTMAMVAPWAPLDCLELVARQAALLWAVDDELEQSSSAVEFAGGLDGIRAAITGRPRDVDTPVTAALAELRADLSGFPLFAELGDAWTDSMVSGISAGFDEWRISRDMAAGGAPPSLDTYLDIATRTILKVPMTLAMLIVTEPESLRAHWDRLEPALWEAAVAVRLANDYGSYERENSAGDLNIRMLGVSRARLRQDIAASLDRFHQHLDPLLGADPLRAAVTVDRYVTAPVEFYLWTDYKSS
jgi:hypothetical protein